MKRKARRPIAETLLITREQRAQRIRAKFRALNVAFADREQCIGMVASDLGTTAEEVRAALDGPEDKKPDGR